MTCSFIITNTGRLGYAIQLILVFVVHQLICHSKSTKSDPFFISTVSCTFNLLNWPGLCTFLIIISSANEKGQSGVNTEWNCKHWLYRDQKCSGRYWCFSNSHTGCVQCNEQTCPPLLVININSLLDLVFSSDFCESSKCIKSNLSSQKVLKIGTKIT